jgi:hypothetical protein
MLIFYRLDLKPYQAVSCSPVCISTINFHNQSQSKTDSELRPAIRGGCGLLGLHLTLEFTRKRLAARLAFFRPVPINQIFLEILQPALPGARARLYKFHETGQAIQGGGTEGMFHFASLKIRDVEFNFQNFG